MRQWIQLAAVFSISLCIPSTARTQQLSPNAQVVTAIVALVNDHVITRADAVRFADPLLRRLQAEALTGGMTQSEFDRRYTEVINAAIENLINRKLILSEFERIRDNSNGAVEFPEKYVESEIQKIVRAEFNGNRLDFIKTISNQGVTLSEYERNIREDLIVEMMVAQHVSSDITISPQKIRDYYDKNVASFKSSEQIKLRLIQVRKQTPNASSLISQVKNKLVDGATFDEMAVLYSQDPNRNKGGDYGWITRGSGRLRKDLEDAAFNLSPGVPSNIIDTEGEYYIMLVEDKKYSTVAPLSEVRSQIEQTLVSEETDRLRQLWVNKLKRNAYIKRDP